MTFLVLIATATIFLTLLFIMLTLVGLQEANDPDESHPEELTRFEKEHVDRPDV